MKRMVLLVLLVASVSWLSGCASCGGKKCCQSGEGSSVTAAIKQLESEWADIWVKRDLGAFERLAASDWVLIDPVGGTLTKAQAVAALKDGTISFQSMVLDEVQVRVFGNAAVVQVLETEKSSYKGEDTSGQYRLTDFYAKRDGRWQVVLSHVTRVVK